MLRAFCSAAMLSNISVIGSPLDWNSQELNGIPPADCGQIPASIEYASSDEYKAAYPLSALFYDFMENNYTTLIADPAIPEYSELSQVMIDAAAEMFTDTPVDVKPILDEAHDKMAAILGS